jgi:RND superfamily putative drug exporter
MQKLADFVVKRHWWIIVAWVIAAGLIIGLSPTLSSVESNDQSSFLPTKYESVQAANLAQKLNPKSSGAVDILVFQNKSHTALTTQEIAQTKQVVAILSADHLKHILSVSTSTTQRLDKLNIVVTRKTLPL